MESSTEVALVNTHVIGLRSNVDRDHGVSADVVFLSRVQAPAFIDMRHAVN